MGDGGTSERSYDLTVARRSSGLGVSNKPLLPVPEPLGRYDSGVREANPIYSGGTATDLHRSSLALATIAQGSGGPGGGQ